MTEQQPAYVPPKKRNIGLWSVLVLVVAFVVVAFVFAERPEPAPVADHSLEPGLLRQADFPTSFHVWNVTQAELDQAPQVELPETVNPTECSELVRTTRRPARSQSVAILEASDAKHGLWYAETILRADEVPEWHPERAQALLDACHEMTYTMKTGASRTVYTTRIDGIAGDGYARSLATGKDYGVGGFTLAVAMTKVGDHIVQFVGVGGVTMSGPTFVETEFVRLANAANERVRSAL